MEFPTDEKPPMNDDDFDAKTAVWMGATVSVIGFCSYVLVALFLPELTSEERYQMKCICAIVTIFGALCIGWRPSHEGDDLD